MEVEVRERTFSLCFVIVVGSCFRRDAPFCTGTHRPPKACMVPDLYSGHLFHPGLREGDRFFFLPSQCVSRMGHACVMFVCTAHTCTLCTSKFHVHLSFYLEKAEQLLGVQPIIWQSNCVPVFHAPIPGLGLVVRVRL